MVFLFGLDGADFLVIALAVASAVLSIICCVLLCVVGDRLRLRVGVSIDVEVIVETDSSSDEEEGVGDGVGISVIVGKTKLEREGEVVTKLVGVIVIGEGGDVAELTTAVAEASGVIAGEGVGVDACDVADVYDVAGWDVAARVDLVLLVSDMIINGVVVQYVELELVCDE